MLKGRYSEYVEECEERYMEGMVGGVISPALVQSEIFKAESLELGIKAIREAMLRAK